MAAILFLGRAEASYLSSECDRIKDVCRGVTQSFQEGVQFAFCFESRPLLSTCCTLRHSVLIHSLGSKRLRC